MWIRSQNKRLLINVDVISVHDDCDDCFGKIIGLFDEQELNENYIVLTDRPFKLKFEDILEKYHFEDGEIIENE